MSVDTRRQVCVQLATTKLTYENYVPGTAFDSKLSTRIRKISRLPRKRNRILQHRSPPVPPPTRQSVQRLLPPAKGRVGKTNANIYIYINRIRGRRTKPPSKFTWCVIPGTFQALSGHATPGKREVLGSVTPSDKSEAQAIDHHEIYSYATRSRTRIYSHRTRSSLSSTCTCSRTHGIRSPIGYGVWLRQEAHTTYMPELCPGKGKACHRYRRAHTCVCPLSETTTRANGHRERAS